VAAILWVIETYRRLKIPIRDYLGSALPGNVVCLLVFSRIVTVILPPSFSLAIFLNCSTSMQRLLELTPIAATWIKLALSCLKRVVETAVSIFVGDFQKLSRGIVGIIENSGKGFTESIIARARREQS
jgi:hypothetical protein